MSTSDKSINICWLQEAGEVAEWGYKIFMLLEEKGIHVRFVATLKHAYELVSKKGIESDFISPSGYHGSKISEIELEALDKKYGHPGMKAIADSTAHFDWLKLKHAERIQIVARHYLFWENYFNQKPIDYAICINVGPVAARTLYNVAKARGIHFSQICVGPSNHHFNMIDVGEDYCWSELLEALKSSPRQLTEEEKKAAYEVINYYSGRRDSPSKIILGWAPNSIIKALRRIKGQLRVKNWKRDPLNEAAFWQVLRLIREQYQWKYFTKKFFRYDLPGPEKYIYFPLYHTYEAPTLARFPYWAKNIYSLVEHIAACLPEGYLLYVKEHPANLGQHSFEQLTKLRKMPRVRVISPERHGRSLIQGSSAVILLENTTGWEAYLNRKPVISLGHSKFYVYSDLVYTVRNINELEKIIWKALAAGEKIYQERENEWLWFIWCVLSTSGQGALYPTEPPYDPFTDENNMNKVADSISEKIKRDIK